MTFLPLATITVSAEISSLLIIHGLLLCALIGVNLPTQFLRRRIHLMNYHTSFLVGCFIFLGVSGIGLATTGAYYTRPQMHDVIKYVSFLTAFMLVYAISYQKISPPQFVTMFLRSQPRIYRNEFPVVISIVALVFSVYSFAIGQKMYVPLVSELLNSISMSLVAFASVFAFGNWVRDRRNLVSLLFALVIIFVCLVLSVMLGSGRRIMLGVLLGFPAVIYWQNIDTLDEARRAKILTWLGVAIVPLFIFMAAYNNVRHFEGRTRHKSNTEKFMAGIQKLETMPTAIGNIEKDISSGKIISDTGQDTAACSLLMIRLADSGRDRALNGNFLIPQPFHSTLFAILNPVPRRIWRDKPLALGFMLPRVGMRWTTVSLGPGVIGHCIHEGGFFFVIFYGVLFGAMMRAFDIALEQSQGDLMQMGLFAAMAPNVLAIVRGDQGVMMVTLIFSIVAFKMLQYFGKYFELPAPAAQHYAMPYPESPRRTVSTRRPMPLANYRP